MAQNDSKWLNWVQSIRVTRIWTYFIILSHFESLWVSLRHFEAFWVRLDLTQAVSKCLKMRWKYYLILAWTMCTFLAYEIFESCVPIYLLAIMVLLWHSLIGPLRKHYQRHKCYSSISKKILFAGSSRLFWLRSKHDDYQCLVPCKIARGKRGLYLRITSFPQVPRLLSANNAP